jgi:hypothetical protein
MAHGLAHAPYLTVAAFANRQQQHRVIVAAPWRHEDHGRW